MPVEHSPLPPTASQAAKSAPGTSSQAAKSAPEASVSGTSSATKSSKGPPGQAPEVLVQIDEPGDVGSGSSEPTPGNELEGGARAPLPEEERNQESSVGGRKRTNTNINSNTNKSKRNTNLNKSSVESERRTRSVTSKDGKVYNKEKRLFETPKNAPKKPSSAAASNTKRRTRKTVVSFSDDWDDLSSDTSKVTRTVKKARNIRGSKAAKGGKANKYAKKTPKRTKSAKSKDHSSTLVESPILPGDSEELRTLGETEEEIENLAKTLLCEGENCFVTLRGRLREFLSHLESSYQAPLHEEEAKQMAEIRKELGSLCFKHLYLKGRGMLNSGDNLGNRLIEGYGQLSEILTQIDLVLIKLQSEARASPSAIDIMTGSKQEGRGVRAPSSRRVANKRGETPPELTSDSSDEDWSPSRIPL